MRLDAEPYLDLCAIREQIQHCDVDFDKLRRAPTVRAPSVETWKIVESRRRTPRNDAPPWQQVGRVCMWMAQGPRVSDDWTPVRIEGVRAVAVGELLIFERKQVRFGVPYELIDRCSESCLSGSAGWLMIPAWYARSLALADV